MDGPRRAEPAYDYVVQGLAGWMSLAGEPGGPPAKTGLSLVDYSGGLFAALALLSGIHAARRDGIGMDCDISLFESALAMLSYPATWYLTSGDEPRRPARSAHPSLVPFQVFPTADGWIVIACPKEKFWRRLASALGAPELGDDPRFCSFEQRLLNREELITKLDSILTTAPTGEWLDRLAAAGIPHGPVNDIAQAFADPQTTARGSIVEFDHPHFGVVRQVASPLRVGPYPPDYRRAPRRHEHAAEVLGDLLGYDSGRIGRLEQAGAFGGQEEP
jgi:crotonobetainyl-CoA:carnitine CoA-transferase CaiB-like acyl-CoA transferase